MGFCLPAATAVKSRFPNAPVVAVLGDAGFAMTGLELLTNVRENLPLTVLVLNDGHDGLIRLKQLQQFGAPFATSLVNPDFEKLAASLGIAYVKLAGDPEPLFRTAIASNATTLLEARLADGPGLTSVKLKSFAKGAVKALGGGAILDAIRGRGA
jgi:acetolactate synthase-1/2/3 large subunit